MQSKIKKYREQGKSLAVKEMKSLALKNEVFEEIEYKSVSDEMKKKTLLLLMFMIIKRNGSNQEELQIVVTKGYMQIRTIYLCQH